MRADATAHNAPAQGSLSPTSGSAATRRRWKVGIVGSRLYTNKAKARKVVQQIIDKLGAENVTIVSGGCPDGGDAIAKDLAINEFKLKYKEFPPVHREWHEHCVLDKSHYSKPFDVKHYFDRNTEIAEYSDILLAFTVHGKPCNGTMDTVGKFIDAGKGSRLIIVED